MSSHRGWRWARRLAAVVLAVALGVPGGNLMAAGTPTTSATTRPTPSPTTSQNLISFLGDVVSWYRDLNTEVGLVEEPFELLYLNDNRNLAAEVVRIAFDYAHAQAALIAKSSVASAQPTAAPTPGQQSLPEMLAQDKAKIRQDKARIAQLSAAAATASGSEKAANTSQLLAAKADLQWQQARAGYIAAMEEFEQGNAGRGVENGGLDAKIDELKNSLVPLENAAKSPSASFTAAPEPTGLIQLSEHLLQNQRKLQALDQRISDTNRLAQEVEKAHGPLRTEFTLLEEQAQHLAQAPMVNDPRGLAQRSNDFARLTERRKLLADTLVPLNEESIAVERYAINLKQWRAQVIQRSTEALHSLLARLAAIAMVIVAILVLGFAWRKLTARYVEDLNRRRQLLKVRDIVVAVLILIVVLFNFTSELAALATVVGFAAAGMVVALQDVFLSLAGYFRLSGRYGMRRGDRVELMGVRGEVLDIGLTKLTLIEFGGEGNSSGATGRLVVIPNSAVFRDKFVNHPPDSRLIWSELSFTVSPDCDYRMIEKLLLDVVDEVFAHYRDRAHRQLLAMERTLNTSLETQRPQSRVRLRSEGLEIRLRYPIEAQRETQVADEISRRLLDELAREPNLRFVPTATPNIQPSPVVATDGAQSSPVAPLAADPPKP